MLLQRMKDREPVLRSEVEQLLRELAKVASQVGFWMGVLHHTCFRDFCWNSRSTLQSAMFYTWDNPIISS